MKLFIDTADIEEIKEANALGVIDGVTTNPSLIAKTGRSYADVIKDIVKIVDGPISVEAISPDTEGMVKEGREFAKIHKNITVKIPMTSEGLKAVKILSKEKIKTNVTLIFSANQALLAAKAGATFVSPFVGRLDDIGQTGMELIDEIMDIYENYEFKTQLIVASIRSPMHVKMSALYGAHVATVPFKVILQLTKHSLTDAGIEKFLKDYEKIPK